MKNEIHTTKLLSCQTIHSNYTHTKVSSKYYSKQSTFIIHMLYRNADVRALGWHTVYVTTYYIQ